jgi:hypothetical protein
MDLYEERMRVPSEKGLELAEADINCNFVECSAVSGVGINDIFNRICQKMLDLKHYQPQPAGL